MWSRLRLDIGWADLFWGAGSVGPPPADPPEVDLVCLSVRSAFDLVLSAVGLPPGSEVLMSALTIPHMPEIVRAHGLVPVPLDVDPDTMAPGAAAFDRACTHRTRVLVVAHLLGGRAPIDEIAQLARGRGILVVEDCAQAYAGDGCSLHDEADVALYSFGTIKTATALGGCVALVRDRSLLDDMRRLHDGYPRQPSAEHRRKLLKAAVLKAASTRPVYGRFVSLVASRGDLDERLHAAVAGFSGDRLLERLRRQPSPSLRRLLVRRLMEVDSDRIARRAALGEGLAAELGPPFELAGARTGPSTHWVVPLLVPEPDDLVLQLRASGFDATRWSSMIAIPRPDGHPCGEPNGARSVLDRAVFVPCYAELSDRAHRELVATLAEAAATAGNESELRSVQSGTQPLG